MVTPTMCAYRELTSITNKQDKRWRVTAQSRRKKSQASIVAAGVRRNCRPVESVCRWGAGGIRRVLKDPAYRRGADPVAELEQFTLDSLIPQQRFSLARRARRS